jgi:hypothetical protein
MSDNTRDQSLAVLRWLIEAGADEAVSESPVNRFSQPQSISPSSQSPPPPSASPLAKAAGDKSRTASVAKPESMPEASADPKLVESFSTADKNGDGYLDASEYDNSVSTSSTEPQQQ